MKKLKQKTEISFAIILWKKRCAGILAGVFAERFPNKVENVDDHTPEFAISVKKEFRQ
ncbi:hypothetical protein ACQRBN_04745 [Bariatricus sp. SGI.154]|uniref:hypothetical protein n=1 Tax=Bariatricus sp. SGI.154 TaxID=3420549 RepID=UPI003D03B903